MQDNDLPEKLDWVFTSATWELTYPDTRVVPLSISILDHIPFVIKVNIVIPKAKIFRFENFWAEFNGFMETVDLHWNSNPIFANRAKTIVGKFKQLRRGLKAWSKSLSNLTRLIHNPNWVLAILDGLEDQRPLCRVAKNFGRIIKGYVIQLLEAKRKYWRQRATIRWIQFGDENTKLFQAIATSSHRRNHISILYTDDNNSVSDHDLKAGFLWNEYKERFGISEFVEMHNDLATLVEHVNLLVLDEPFSKEKIDAALKDIPSNHAPGPDGFNGFFIKKYWSIVSEDIYKLF